jgi:hypothetical protein
MRERAPQTKNFVLMLRSKLYRVIEDARAKTEGETEGKCKVRSASVYRVLEAS